MKQAILVVLLSCLIGCQNKGGTSYQRADRTTATPVPTPAPVLPSKSTWDSNWDISNKRVNQIDKVVTQFVATRGPVRLALCFDNGKLCKTSVPLYVKAPCWIDGNGGEYHSRQIRLKFDDDKFRVERWGITDDHSGLTPPRGRRRQFIAELKQHEVLLFEFGCDRSDPGEVITFHISGLQDALDTAGVTTN